MRPEFAAVSRRIPSILSVVFAAIAVAIGLWQWFDHTTENLLNAARSSGAMTIPGDFIVLLSALVSQGRWSAYAAGAAGLSVLLQIFDLTSRRRSGA
jgi:hypothetical protein